MIHVRSWRSGHAGFGQWHLWWGAMRLPLCGTLVPKEASMCELHHSPALHLDQLCKRCLMAYALSETQSTVKEPA
jgi:hypothetical protein